MCAFRAFRSSHFLKFPTFPKELNSLLTVSLSQGDPRMMNKQAVVAPTFLDIGIAALTKVYMSNVDKLSVEDIHKLEDTINWLISMRDRK